MQLIFEQSEDLGAPVPCTAENPMCNFIVFPLIEISTSVASTSYRLKVFEKKVAKAKCEFALSQQLFT